MDNHRAADILANVRSSNPLIHNITNLVVTNFTANGLLALGASPVMAYAKEEVADMARIAGALALNMGTLDEQVVQSMRIAGTSAAAHGVPIVFDPVGAGATPYRTETARSLVNGLPVTVIRGNAAEVANVVGEDWGIKGVDAAVGSNQDVASLARKAAQALGCVTAITGKDDYVSDGKVTYRISNGTPLLTKVTGTGCLLSSVIAAFLAVEKDAVAAAVSALAYYGVAAENAVQVAGDDRPGGFQIEFLNHLHRTGGEAVRQQASIHRVE